MADKLLRRRLAYVDHRQPLEMARDDFVPLTTRTAPAQSSAARSSPASSSRLRSTRTPSTATSRRRRLGGRSPHEGAVWDGGSRLGPTASTRHGPSAETALLRARIAGRLLHPALSTSTPAPASQLHPLSARDLPSSTLCLSEHHAWVIEACFRNLKQLRASPTHPHARRRPSNAPRPPLGWSTRPSFSGSRRSPSKPAGGTSTAPWYPHKRGFSFADVLRTANVPWDRSTILIRPVVSITYVTAAHDRFHRGNSDSGSPHKDDTRV